MFDLSHAIGLGAAIGSSIAFFPQVLKVWRTRQTDHLSLITFAVLTTAVSLWIVYGILREDPIIIGANIVTVAMLVYLLAMKVIHVLARPKVTPLVVAMPQVTPAPVIATPAAIVASPVIASISEEPVGVLVSQSEADA